MAKADYLEHEIKKLNIEINDLQIRQFIKYYEMLYEKNKVMNLTAITEFEEVVTKHFVDSLAVIKAINIHDVSTVIDIGTGAGFPGIPLKIAFPHLKIILADSLNKRVLFLNEVIDELGLESIEAIHGRAEEIGRNKEYRDKFDLCVSRAVANMATLSEYCMPFVKVGGKFVCYKAGNAGDEINSAKKAIKILQGDIEKIDELKLPDTDIERTFAVIKKIGKTPKAYPRKAGTPSKAPIL